MAVPETGRGALFTDGIRFTDKLPDRHGARSMGCDRSFDDPRYPALDRNAPRAPGRLNRISNRILPCGP